MNTAETVTDAPQLFVTFPGWEGAIPFPKFYLRGDAAFFDFCNSNADTTLCFEREADGEVRLMPPSSTDTGRTNATILGLMFVWNTQNSNPGVVSDSSAGFKLPNSAIRAPDVAYVEKSRYDAVMKDERNKHAALVLDFVVEVMSPSDRLPVLQAKMREYADNGVRLGWLINRKTRTVYVFRQGVEMQTLTDATELSAAPELPGFVLATDTIFSADM